MDVGSGGGDAGAVEGSARYCRADGFRGGAYRRGRRCRDGPFHGRCPAEAGDVLAGGDPDPLSTEHDEDGDDCSRHG
ncbi:hypothetical protein A5757_10335 [Mycobacterium sp. 852013-51886_SCH5428379]|uniref:hypothetical protein n=1 Tax=Mycobacterium sp. 852013-51886_SCH5428379 TaxID=1834111 RepID=UPI0007FD1539|nr:hypothetical protein [Mycobacterium sp. 852013-51886_SCH5428379]OBB60063.1 hypothetical protein A5757_10335 [Mycobacterium sp. 852013-51886_SCH5428379]